MTARHAAKAKPLWSRIQSSLHILHRSNKEPKRLISSGLSHDSHRLSMSERFAGNNVSFWILVASFVLLMYSLYLFLLRDSQETLHSSANDIQLTILDEESAGTVASDQADIERYITVDQGVVVPVTRGLADPATDTQALEDRIIQLYDAINATEYKRVADFFDRYMQSTETVRIYFAADRVQTFMQALDEDISVQSVQVGNPERKDRYPVHYTISYSLQGERFVEEWSALMRPEMNEWKIGSIRCESKGCSNFPFYNFAKYGIQ